MQIWLQRVTLPTQQDIQYDEPLCKLVAGENNNLWNNEWIVSSELKNAVLPTKVIDQSIRDQLTPTIQPDEFELFLSNLDGYGG